jgi:hypothetical protein
LGNGIIVEKVLDRIDKIDRIKKGQADEEENGVPDENLD